MSNNVKQSVQAIDSDNEEFDCQVHSLSPEHLSMFRKVTRENGRINQLTRRQLIDKLSEKNLKKEGEIDILRKRLKNHYKMEALFKAKLCDSTATCFPYFVVIDIEATCTEKNPSDYKYV